MVAIKPGVQSRVRITEERRLDRPKALSAATELLVGGSRPCLNQGRSGNPSLCSFTTSNNNDRYVGFYATENTGLVLPGDLTAQVLTQYAGGSFFGVAAGDKTLASAGSIPADVGSMHSGGWGTIAIALRSVF